MLITVKVYPNSKKESVIKKSERRLEVRVKEKAEGGLANATVRKVLAVYFRVPVASVRLVKGGKQPNKIFQIAGFDFSEI